MPEEIFPNVFEINGRIATRSLAAGYKVYGEQLVRIGDIEYRMWDAQRSKLGAAIVKGLETLDIEPGSSVLYLGAASGTTVSHVSDVVGRKGVVYCVEFAPRCMRDLLNVCERRGNMMPLLEDARFPEHYADVVNKYSKGKVDCVFEDVADPEQVRILKENCKAFLKPGGQALIAVKSKSISAVTDRAKIFATVEKELSDMFEIVQKFPLEPFDKDHMFLSLRMKEPSTE